MGWQPKVNLKEGIKLAYESFISGKVKGRIAGAGDRDEEKSCTNNRK